jgi:predicted nucleic acid-binding protein
VSNRKKSTIEVQGAEITILTREHGDYISLTDMVRNFVGGSALIEQWLKNKDTVLFLGVWEQMHNPKFNSLEFEGIRNEAGRGEHRAENASSPGGSVAADARRALRGIHRHLGGRPGGTFRGARPLRLRRTQAHGVKEAFADTFYFLALLDRRDAHHQRVVEFATSYRGALVTTRWVLAEAANALGGSPVRPAVARLLRQVEEDASFRVIRDSDALYERGLALFAMRRDKEWSLTDCVSFVVMDALTADRHFEQAGFKALLA